MIRQLKTLFATAAVPRWAVPVITGLGILSAFLESATLLTFIPLFRLLAAADPAGLLNGAATAKLWGTSVAYTLPMVLATLVALVVAKTGTDLINTFLIKRVEGVVTHGLRARILAATFASMAERHADSNRTEIANIIATNSWKVGAALVLGFRIIIGSLTAIALLVTMAVISPGLTALALVFLSVALVAVRAASRLAGNVGHHVVVENRRFGERMMETVNSLQLIRSFSREGYELGRFRVASDQLRRRLLQLDLLWALPAPIAEISTIVVLASLIVVGGLFGTPVPVLSAFLAMLYRLQAPARGVLECKLGFDGQVGAIDDVASFLARAEAPGIVDGSVVASPVKHQICFENVSFRYADDGPWALRGVSFAICADEMTGIVGGSGAGKSTLMLLLFRFHDPTEGRITVDGVPLTSLDVASWRAQLALMSQDVHLFNDTIDRNIAYGDLRATPVGVREAARVAGIATFVESLPDGYATEVGTAGFRLSGGQRQRVALARAILKQPSVLLLDEATNALDVEAEDHFRTALAAFGTDRTIIAIAHRLSTIRAAAKIIVLERGTVVEIGAPAELLARGGRFAALHDLQAAGMASAGAG